MTASSIHVDVDRISTRKKEGVQLKLKSKKKKKKTY